MAGWLTGWSIYLSAEMRVRRLETLSRFIFRGIPDHSLYNLEAIGNDMLEIKNDTVGTTKGTTKIVVHIAGVVVGGVRKNKTRPMHGVSRWFKPSDPPHA